MRNENKVGKAVRGTVLENLGRSISCSPVTTLCRFRRNALYRVLSCYAHCSLHVPNYVLSVQLPSPLQEQQTTCTRLSSKYSEQVTTAGLKVRGLGGLSPQLREEWGGRLSKGIRKGVSGEREPSTFFKLL